MKRKARFVFITLLVLMFMAGGVLWAVGYFDDMVNSLISGGTVEAFEGRINVLVIGTDTRQGEDTARADTLMMCSVDTEKNLISILSIPRDTRVDIPGHGYDKINSSTIYGGPAMAMRTVSGLLGVRISKYAMIDYEGFKNLVDALGGVTMDVQHRMYHYDPQDRGAYTIDIRPGLQELDGDKALQFVRYRSYPLGDIQRTEQQQKFLTALIKEVLQPTTVVKLPKIIIKTYGDVDTNLSLMEMKELAEAAGKMNASTVVTQTLPGKFLNYDGISYWEADPIQSRQIVAAIMEGQSGSKVVLGETTINTKSSDSGASEATDSNPDSVTDPATNQEVGGVPSEDVNAWDSSNNTTGGSSSNTSSSSNSGGSKGASGGIIPPGQL
ncbi:MAG: LCP family protein [Peptococcaceae bacterium]|nr:LCP family protein [Peptococcaceae bacterium]